MSSRGERGNEREQPPTLDWTSVSSTFSKQLLEPNKHYYVTDPSEIVHALSRQRSVRARSSSMICRGPSGNIIEDNRQQALREEVALRKQLVEDIEKSVAMQRGAKMLPMSLWTRQYDKYVVQRRERDESAHPNDGWGNASGAGATVCGASSILSSNAVERDDAGNGHSSKKVRGVSSRLYSPPTEQPCEDEIVASSNHSRKMTAREQLSSVRRLYDERVLQKKQRHRQSLRAELAALYHGPRNSPENIAANVDRFYTSGLQQQNERRRKLLEKYLAKPSTPTNPKNFDQETADRLYSGDMAAQAEVAHHLVAKYADDNRPVASKYAPKVSRDDLADIFVRVSSRCASSLS